VTKSKSTLFSLFVSAILLLIGTTSINAQMPDTTPRMPGNLINSVFGALPKMPGNLVNSVFGALPKMPDITKFLANMIPSGIRKFLAPPSPSNLPQQLGEWQQEPTPTNKPTPTLPPGAKIQVGPYKYTPSGAAEKAGVPSFTINTPSGWASYPISGTQLAHFESGQIDTETVKDGEITTNAVIIVRGTDAYSSLEEFEKDYKASGKKARGYQQVSSTSNRLEFKFKTKVDGKEITLHELDYLFFKDGISFLIKGYSSDSAWDTRAGEIQSALDSFKFN
jgi:hypothetical protein